MSTPVSRIGYGDDKYDYEPGIKLLRSIFPRYVVDHVKTFPMETGDVVIATYAKAGTTWMSEVASQIHLQDDVEATQVNIMERVPHMEMKVPIPGSLSVIDQLQNAPRPRLMRTHMPSQIFHKQLLEGKGKFIIVMRNIKDNLVSFYHFHRAVHMYRYQGTWDDFFELFRSKQLLWGDWLQYNLSWWAYRDHPNVAIFKYEDMKKNRRESIKKVAQFCQEDVSDETLDRITEATSFGAMKDNPATNMREMFHPHIMDFDTSPFIRKGEVGDWRQYFSDEQNAFVEEHYLKEAAKLGLHFDTLI